MEYLPAAVLCHLPGGNELQVTHSLVDRFLIHGAPRPLTLLASFDSLGGVVFLPRPAKTEPDSPSAMNSVGF